MLALYKSDCIDSNILINVGPTMTVTAHVGDIAGRFCANDVPFSLYLLECSNYSNGNF